MSHAEKQLDALRLFTRYGEMPVNHFKTKANLHGPIEQRCDYAIIFTQSIMLCRCRSKALLPFLNLPTELLGAALGELAAHHRKHLLLLFPHVSPYHVL